MRDSAKTPNGRKFYILSLKWTRREDCVTWWAPDCKGYTTLLEHAGQYTEEDVKQRSSYLNDGTSTLAVPCDIANRFATRVVLQENVHALLTTVFDKPTSLVGSTVDDTDYEGRDQCPTCERGYGSPGPSRFVHPAPEPSDETKTVPREVGRRRAEISVLPAAPVRIDSARETTKIPRA